MDCPCRSGRPYEACCGRFITQSARPENAEALMRSRYTAHVLGDEGYLAATWHPDHRPRELNLDAGVRWIGLEILEAKEAGDAAMVEFEARFLAGGRVDALRERSRFVRVSGRWFYTDGEMRQPRLLPFKPGRNEPCPCGSGRKFKRCCG